MSEIKVIAVPDVSLSEFMTRTHPSDLQEQLEVLEMLREDYNAAHKKYDAADRAMREYLNSGDFNTREVDDSVVNETLRQMDSEEKAALSEVRLLGTALRGCRGAVEYFMALRVKEVWPRVLEKFMGKPAGPKTSARFTKYLCDQLSEGDPKWHVYWRSYHQLEVKIDGVVTTYVDFIGEYADRDNKFCDGITWKEPRDHYRGSYPGDWLDWAKCVDKANAFLHEQFDKYQAQQKMLHDYLHVGEVAMAHVSSTAMKEECGF